MTDADLNRYATKIVEAVQDPECYARANTAIAQARARRTPGSLLGGLELPCYVQERIRSAFSA